MLFRWGKNKQILKIMNINAVVANTGNGNMKTKNIKIEGKV